MFGGIEKTRETTGADHRIVAAHSIGPRRRIGQTNAVKHSLLAAAIDSLLQSLLGKLRLDRIGPCPGFKPRPFRIGHFQPLAHLLHPHAVGWNNAFKPQQRIRLPAKIGLGPHQPMNGVDAPFLAFRQNEIQDTGLSHPQKRARRIGSGQEFLQFRPDPFGGKL